VQVRQQDFGAERRRKPPDPPGHRRRSPGVDRRPGHAAWQEEQKQALRWLQTACQHPYGCRVDPGGCSDTGEIVPKKNRHRSAANVKPGLFGKRDFKIDIRGGTITCPAGEVESFEPGAVVEFDPEACGPCRLRAKCTQAASSCGRTVTMGDAEALQKKLRRLQSTPAGSRELRERVAVEHGLAHVSNRQGPRARYRGTRNNAFDLRRLGVIHNLEVIARRAA
jgi:Transposase DDE domain